MVYETTNEDMSVGLREGGYIGGANIISKAFNLQRDVTTGVKDLQTQAADSNEFRFVGKKYKVSRSFTAKDADQNDIVIPSGSTLQVNSKIKNSLGNVGSTYSVSVFNDDSSNSYNAIVNNIDIVNNATTIDRVKENMAKNGKVYTVPADRTIKTLDGNSITLKSPKKFIVYDNSVVEDKFGQRKYMYGFDESTGEQFLIPQEFTAVDQLKAATSTLPINTVYVTQATENANALRRKGSELMDTYNDAKNTYNSFVNDTNYANNSKLPPCDWWTWFTGQPCDDGQPPVNNASGGCNCGNIGNETSGGSISDKFNDIVYEVSNMSRLQTAILIIECLIVIMLIVLMINYTPNVKNITLISIVALFVLMLVDYFNIF